MQEVSEAYLEAVAYKSRRFYVRCNFPLLGDYITEKNIWSGSYNDMIDPNGILSMGNACAKKVEMTLHSLSGATIWKGAEFAIECGLKVPDEGIVYVPWGTFWVTDMSTSNNHRTVKLTAYDRMYTLSRTAYITALQGPFHYRDLVDEFLQKSGMTLSEASVALLPDREDATYTINSWPEMDFSFSDIAGHLAGMIGCNARVSVADPNVLEFVWYEATGTIIKRTLYQDGLEKLSDSELRVDYLVTGENSEIVVENTDDIDDGEIDFSEFDVVDPADLPVLKFTYDTELLTASVELADGCESYTEAIVIPDLVRYDGVVYTVNSIPANGFEGSSASQIIMPNTIETIGSAAFMSCNSITEITIPASVTSISHHVLSGCDNLTLIYLNAENCSYFSEGTFTDLSNDTVVIIGNTVSSISSVCFRSASKVVAVSIPNSVTSIGSYAFYNSGIKSIVIPDSVTTIEAYAFSGCKALTDFVMGNGVTTLAMWAFSGCTALVNLTLGNSLTSIPIRALSGCTSLTSVIVPNSVTSIGRYAFYGSSKLARVQIGESDACAIATIDSAAFSSTSALTELIVYAPVDSVRNSPWGASNATVTWMG